MLRHLTRWLLIVLLAVLPACINLARSKSLVVPVRPGQTEVAVTSTVNGWCGDFIVVLACKYELDLKAQ